MRAGVGVLAVVAGLALAAGAFGTESTIYPGVGIGKVKLGMTLAQVKHSLGHDYLVNSRDNGYLELGWNFASWTVGFKKSHVVLVSTTLRAQRTPAGAGPGALWLRVVRAYPGGRCTFKFVNYFWRVEYLVPHRGGTQTLFVFRDVFDRAKGKLTGYSVLEVSVRTPYERLPEFTPGWRDQCATGWATTAVPRLKQG
jgi:hypothetical protein